MANFKILSGRPYDEAAKEAVSRLEALYWTDNFDWVHEPGRTEAKVVISGHTHVASQDVLMDLDGIFIDMAGEAKLEDNTPAWPVGYGKNNPPVRRV